MRRRFFTTMMCLFTSIFTASADAKTKRAILIGLDGVRPDALAQAQTPNIDTLIAKGAYTDDADNVGTRYRKSDTISGPGWGSILSGVWADKHGVDGNKHFEKYRSWPTIFSHVHAARPDDFTAAIATWKPITDHLARDAKSIQYVAPVKKNYTDADRKVAKAAVNVLKTSDPILLFVYFGQIDETGHKKGFHPSVAEYVAAIERVDALVGDVMAALKSRKEFADEDWLVAMTTDHGGKGTGHGRGHDVPEIRKVFLLVSGGSTRRGNIAGPAYIVDAPATVLKHLGIVTAEKWKLDGRAVGLTEPKVR